MSYRTSKYQQRLARQANFKRKKSITVFILIMGKPFIGEAIHTTVAIKKENFVNSSYRKAIK